MKKINQQYFASCPVGLENILEEELHQLGILGTANTKGGVHFQGSFELALQALFQSHIASRIYKKAYLFEAKNEQDFYEKMLSIPWHEEMKAHKTFSFKVLFTHSKKRKVFFKNSQFMAMKSKDALCDRFRKEQGKRPNVNTEDPDFDFLIHIKADDKKDKITVLLDLCGEPLSNRKYRKPGFPAPLRENLAAGLIKLSRWDSQTQNFFDPFCGSGTLLIEALLMGKKLPAQLIKLKSLKEKPHLKLWSFQKHQFFDLKSMIQQMDLEGKELECLIEGRDLHPNAISIAKYHLEQLGLKSEVKLSQADFLNSKPSPSSFKTLILTNPPYGERLQLSSSESSFFMSFKQTLLEHYPLASCFLIHPKDSSIQEVIHAQPMYDLKNGNISSCLYKVL